MFYFNKKIMDIAIAHVVVQLFFMPLFSIMSTLKYQQNFTTEQILTSLEMENNTNACLLVGAGSEHRKTPVITPRVTPRLQMRVSLVT
jgi:hypothetical protein